MSEFSAGVKILLERMKSNPEDFELQEFDMKTMHRVEGRFYKFGQNMEQMITGRDKEKLLAQWIDWHYLTKEEQEALIEGFKVMNRAKLDKQIMERVFDETYVQRQREYSAEMNRTSTLQLRSKTAQSQQATQLRPMQQENTTTTNSTTGLLGAIGLGGLFGGGQ